MVLELEHTHTVTLGVLADKVQARIHQTVNVLGVDLIAVAMSLLNDLSSVVQFAELRPLGARLEDGLVEAEAHRAAHVVTVDVGHMDDDAVLGDSVELLRIGTRKRENIPGKLDDGDLETEAHL